MFRIQLELSVSRSLVIVKITEQITVKVVGATSSEGILV